MDADQQVNSIIVSKDTLVREGMRALFADSRYKVSEEFSTIEDAIALPNAGADLLFVGSSLDDQIIDPLKSLRQIYPKARVVLYVGAIRLPTNTLIELIASTLDGCLASSASLGVIMQSLDLIMLGEAIFPLSLVFSAIPPDPDSGPSVRVSLSEDRAFSDRELQVLDFLRRGKSNKSIARELQISEATVKVHIKTVLRKIGASNRTQAAIWAVKNRKMFEQHNGGGGAFEAKLRVEAPSL